MASRLVVEARAGYACVLMALLGALVSACSAQHPPVSDARTPTLETLTIDPPFTTCELWGYVRIKDGVPQNDSLVIELTNEPGITIKKEVKVANTDGSYRWSNASVGAGSAWLKNADSEKLPVSCYPVSGVATNFYFKDATGGEPGPACTTSGFVLDTDGTTMVHDCDKSQDPHGCKRLCPSNNQGAAAELHIDGAKAAGIKPQDGHYECINCSKSGGEFEAVLHKGTAKEAKVKSTCFNSSVPQDLVVKSGAATCYAPPCRLWGYVLKNGSVPPASDYLKFTTYGTNIQINDSTGFYDCPNCAQGTNPVRLNNTGAYKYLDCADSVSQRNVSFP